MINIFSILFLLTINALLELRICQDCDLKHRYEKVLSALDEESLLVAKMYNRGKDMSGNKAALIQESVDTLNKNEIVLTKFVEGTTFDKETILIGIAGGRKENDTLTIFVGGMMASETIEHVIVNGSVKTYYKEWYKDDKLLKKTKDENPINELKIEVINNEFEICQEGEVYYGYSKFQVDPYYKIDQYNLNQFLRIQRNYEYYFKFKIQ